MLKEYAMLRSRYGRGESACMAYCRYTNNVIGSSNIKDIKEYCKKQKIVYLASVDFLYYAFVRGKMTAVECSEFISEVNSKGSRLPDIDITQYMPDNMI